MENEGLDVSAAIGRTLFGIQIVEHLLGFLLRTAFSGQTMPTVEELEEEKEFVWKATLGRLIMRLKERVELDSEFEQYLVQFHKDRDFFAHHLLDLLITSDSQEPTRLILGLCDRIRETSLRLIEMFSAVLFKWYESLKPNEPMDEGIKLYMEQAGSWQKSIDELFRVRQ
jgi:hypothetical protein